MSDLLTSYQLWLGCTVSLFAIIVLVFVGSIIYKSPKPIKDENEQEQNDDHGECRHLSEVEMKKDFFEHRLVRLQGILEIYLHYKYHLNEDNTESWREKETSETLDIEWITSYCQREMNLIARELSKEILLSTK